jgi:hypothetical protein
MVLNDDANIGGDSQACERSSPNAQPPIPTSTVEHQLNLGLVYMFLFEQLQKLLACNVLHVLALIIFLGIIFLPVIRS